MNKLKDKIQQEALQAWKVCGKRGTCEIITGLGKTFISLHALYTMKRWDQDKKTHLFLAETIERANDLQKDIDKFDKLFGKMVYQDYRLKFMTYQSAYKLNNENFGLVIADEIHDALSPAYSQFFLNNQYEAIIGLSATIKSKQVYEIDNKLVSKIDLLNQIAPICYTYNINQGQIDGTSRQLNIYIINHNLDKITKNIEAGSKKKRFYQTEEASYKYWDNEHKKSWYIIDEKLKQLKITITAHKRSNILYNLPSKNEIIKKLLYVLRGKNIIFGNSLDALLEITSNVISSRNSEKQNKAIRDAFEDNKIQTIASFKKLKQGANLDNLDNCIIISYYSIEKDIIQRFGRLRQNGKIGNVFIIKTLNTQEAVWFSSMMENLTEFNIIECDNVEDCIQKYKNNEMDN